MSASSKNFNRWTQVRRQLSIPPMARPKDEPVLVLPEQLEDVNEVPIQPTPRLPPSCRQASKPKQAPPAIFCHTFPATSISIILAGLHK